MKWTLGHDFGTFACLPDDGSTEYMVPVATSALRWDDEPPFDVDYRVDRWRICKWATDDGRVGWIMVDPAAWELGLRDGTFD